MRTIQNKWKAQNLKKVLPHGDRCECNKCAEMENLEDSMQKTEECGQLINYTCL